jgi:hypothetical protein
MAPSQLDDELRGLIEPLLPAPPLSREGLLLYVKFLPRIR